jgi:phosphate transport system protein
MVLLMLRQSLRAYTRNDVELAHEVARQDDQVDQLCAAVFSQLVQQMAATQVVDQVESGYELMRVAQELERFGDLATNIAERVIYRVTGQMKEVNTDETGPTRLELPVVEETAAQS